MAYRFTRQRVRLKCNIAKADAAMTEIITGGTPKFGRYAAVQFEVGLFYNEELVDISNISAATLTIRETRTGTVQMTQTIGPTAMNKALTSADWSAAGSTAQHFLFTFASNLTGIGSGETSSHWLVLHGLTSDDALDVDVFGGCGIQVYETGITGVTAPVPPAEGGVTLSQVQALMNDYQKKIGEPGQLLTLCNNVGQKRLLGLDDSGTPIDSIET